MKKFFKILAVVVVVGVGVYAAWYAYAVSKYKQHLPLTEISVSGVDRDYRLFVPTNEADGPNSLLVLLEGGSADGNWRFPQQFEWEARADEEGIIIAIPVGMQVGDNEGAWQLNTDSESMQDIEFAEAMITDIASKHTVDESRVYAVGYSLGSMFSYELACQMNTRFAAIASFAGTMPVAPTSCEPERNVPIMHIHGANDGIIAYSNTWDWKSWDSVGTMRDIPSLVQYWKEKYNCQNQDETASESVTHFVYDACEQNARVEHYRLENGDHGWPIDLNGEPTHNLIWSFLSNYSLP